MSSHRFERFQESAVGAQINIYGVIYIGYRQTISTTSVIEDNLVASTRFRDFLQHQPKLDQSVWMFSKRLAGW